MTDPQPYGRTAWDFAADAIKSKAMVFFVVAFLLVIALVVHMWAEQGTEVSLLGDIIKYQKAKSATPSVPLRAPATPPSIVGYVLPKSVDLGSIPKPILDGTLSVAAPSTSLQWPLCLSGANLDIVSFAMRTPQGERVEPKAKGDKVLIPAKDVHIELEYKGNFFVIETEQQTGDEATFVMTVSKVDVPTMVLKRVGQYAAGH